MGKIIIGCDNAAVSLKNTVAEFARAKGYEVEDLGVAAESDDTVYPEIAARVCRRLAETSFQARGILICGTGIGMSIAANKFPGIYAAVIHDIFSAERAALSNNANVACMGARVLAPQLALKLVAEWLGLEYKSGSSDSKIAAIKKIEADNFK